jgi:hypothetical protein
VDVLPISNVEHPILEGFDLRVQPRHPSPIVADATTYGPASDLTRGVLRQDTFAEAAESNPPASASPARL